MTLFEIASVIGILLTFDVATQNKAFGHSAPILVDKDLSRRIFYEIMVEQDRYAFKVEVVYEKFPELCYHWISIGHNISTCHWLQQKKEAVKVDHGKKPLIPGRPSSEILLLNLRDRKLFETCNNGYKQ